MYSEALPALRSGARALQLRIVRTSGSGRFSVYVPDELAKDVETAIQNGRDLQKLITEAGRRYTVALKNARSSRV